MGGYYINLHVKTSDAPLVRDLLTTTFISEGFTLIGSEAASAVAEDEDKLPEGDAWYGVLLSGESGKGWVSVYVADWADSGFLAKRLSQAIGAPVLELWVADDIHWGYTYYESGTVKDRFADDPAPLAETEAETALYAGQAEALVPILRVPTKQLEILLQDARSQAGQFAGGPLDALAQAVGLPFEHVFTGYDYFFEDDPDDYSQDLENWPEFRHLAFQPPAGRETLSE
jgi:hypothetical protein